MIQLQGAGKRFGHKLLFEDCDWLITPRERTGLVGGNGTGKSTLLKILCGMETLDYGSLSMTKGMTIGYLPQDGLSLTGRTVFAEAMTVFDQLREMEKELEALHHSLGELDPASPEYAAAADRAHHIDSEFRNRDGYAIEAQVGTVLDGLGFRKEDWERRTEEFSGGWQMRLALAKLLLEKPSLLLLDEPTNHLDLEARNWLESYLTNYPGAYLLISHDRYFLDVTVNRTVEIWNKRVQFYSGNYDKYLRAEDRAARSVDGGLSQSARAHRATGSVHQPLSRAGDQGQAGAVAHQRAGQDRAHRDSAGRADHPLQVSAAQAQRADRGGIQGRLEELRAEVRVRRRQLRDRARRPRVAGGRERRGQVHHDQAAGGRGAADVGLLHAGPQRDPGLFRAGSVQGAGRRTRACWTI